MDIKQKLGKRVKELRLQAGYSQEAFAHECGLDRTYIASMESGKRNVSIVNIEKIASALNLTVINFFDSEIFDGD
jgi:transcriptional regulator with XRE-family HTH domain